MISCGQHKLTLQKKKYGPTISALPPSFTICTRETILSIKRTHYTLLLLHSKLFIYRKRNNEKIQRNQIKFSSHGIFRMRMHFARQHKQQDINNFIFFH